jgi:uncharacterized protein (UPF0333 family)
MFIKLNKRGQSTLEYGVLIAIIVGALLVMQVYIKRGVQGKLRQATDDIGSQFSPGYTTYTSTTRSGANSTENIAGGFHGDTTSLTVQNQTRNMVENVANLANETWR